MKGKPSARDLQILSALADYEILTTSQLATLLFPSRQMTRKKTRDLRGRGLVELRSPGIGSTLGRPESLVALTPDGYRVLKRFNDIRLKIVPSRPIAVHSHDTAHHIAINWLRIHLDHLVKQLQRLRVMFLSPSAHSDVYRFAVDPPRPLAGIIPDGVFSITDTETNRSLLFFLEVDMGTETLSSRRAKTKDIRKKIVSYQEIFRKLRYKQLESHFEQSFRGFRVLFTANQESRLLQLSNLVKSIPSTGFVWLALLDDVFRRGMAAPFWLAGGAINEEPRSILGHSLACDLPLTIPN